MKNVRTVEHDWRRNEQECPYDTGYIACPYWLHEKFFPWIPVFDQGHVYDGQDKRGNRRNNSKGESKEHVPFFTRLDGFSQVPERWWAMDSHVVRRVIRRLDDLHYMPYRQRRWLRDVGHN